MKMTRTTATSSTNHRLRMDINEVANSPATRLSERKYRWKSIPPEASKSAGFLAMERDAGKSRSRRRWIEMAYTGGPNNSAARDRAGNQQVSYFLSLGWASNVLRRSRWYSASIRLAATMVSTSSAT